MPNWHWPAKKPPSSRRVMIVRRVEVIVVRTAPVGQTAAVVAIAAGIGPLAVNAAPTVGSARRVATARVVRVGTASLARTVASVRPGATTADLEGRQGGMNRCLDR